MYTHISNGVCIGLWFAIGTDLQSVKHAQVKQNSEEVAFLSGKKKESNIIQETAEMSRSGSKMSFVWQIEITFRPCGNRLLFPLLLLCFAFRTCFWQLKMSFYASCNTLVAGSKIGLR